MASSSTKASTSGSFAAKPKAAAEVADSWEDADVSDPEDVSPSPASNLAIPKAPPPTPISPIVYGDATWPTGAGTAPPAAAQAPDGQKRPEKTDAVARRMIAAGLGLKAPKQTEEQKAYQKAIKEQEKKRREQERAEEQRRLAEIEKAKAAVWDD
ncbi:hypothetical protein HJFPF1_00510 [Paramyrothecium foliicola]|nr:hypothetical protein HJFPF1_00510 [Paramyrothecium foliicola]